MNQNELRCLYWNIHGISSQIMGDKNKDPHFLSIIKDFDVVAISEMHTKVNVQIPGFHLKKQKFRPKNHKGPKIGGGIAVYVNQKVANNFRLLPNDNVDSIWIKTSLGLGADELRLGFYYCSPDRKGSNLFEIVNQEIEKINNGKNTYIFGDFNARTKTLFENIVHDKMDDQLGVQTVIKTIPPSRNSEDQKLVNNRGHEFLDLCRANDLSIANGRTIGDLYGKYTCHQKRGSSVVDYLIAPHKALGNISHFKVGEFRPLLSDHSPIMATIQLQRNLLIEEEKEVQMHDLPKRLSWDDEKITSYQESLNSDKFKEEVGKLMTKPDGVTPHEVQALLLKVPGYEQDPGKVCQKANKQRTKKNNRPWFDNECKKIKREILDCGKTLRSAPHAVCVREKIYVLKKKLRNLVRKKKQAFQTAIIDEMCTNLSHGEQKKYWKQLKRLDTSKDSNKYIPDYTLISHFREILQDDDIKLKYSKQNGEEGILDYEITDEELKRATKILKLGKGIGIDNIYNEMIRPLVDTYPQLVTRLFNDILAERQQFSKQWLHSLVTAIHKKGPKEDPDNYRGISLMSCLGKFFLTVINNRLTEFCLHKGILSPSQLGFVKGNRTSDPHIILNNILQKYCHRSKKKLFGCFVDFSKAFDTVPRDILLEKLKKHGINGKIFNIIQTIYLEDTVSIKIGNKHSSSFKTNKGVRQGCVLSPLLFNIFLADLQPILDGCGDNVKVDQQMRISCLLWADDILMLSETDAGLQKKLKALEKYCDQNKLSVNTKKTQCMVFNKTGRLLKNYTFTYKSSQLECVREYKYLGFMITPSGEVRTGLEDLRRRALKAYSKLRTTLGPLFKQNVENSMHLYNYMVKPILTYCSDFWGCLQPKNNPVEKVHTMFCKHLLGVRKQTNTDGVLQEMGMIPLQLYAAKSVVKNWERIQQKKANNILVASNKFSSKENLPWAFNIKTIFSLNGMERQYTQKINETQERKYGPISNKLYKVLLEKFHYTSFENIKTRSKMKTLNMLKKTPGRESYLKDVTNIKHRNALSKLRLSAHRLEIETGRYKKKQSKKIPAEERFCAFCHFHGQETVEDEIHFLINCPMLKELRESSLPSDVLQNKDLNAEQKFVELMTNSDVKLVSKFVYQAFNEREIRMDVLSTLKDMVSSTELMLKNGEKAPNPKNFYEVKWLSDDGMKLKISEKNAPDPGKPDTYQVQWYDGLKLKLSKT